MDSNVENKGNDETTEVSKKEAPKEEKVKKAEEKAVKDIKTKLLLSTAPSALSVFQSEIKKKY